MKFITILLITVFINACSGSKNAAVNAVKEEVETSIEKDKLAIQNKDMVIEYKEQTRGFYKMIKITPEIVSGKFKHDGEIKSKPCDKELWSSLMNEMEAISLNELPELEAPSKAHQYDGAAMANLSVTKGKQTYITKTFDAGKPHEKIASLIEKIIKSIEEQ